MTYKLHMNGVITGSLNSFCLACDIFLTSQHEATDHIGTSEHKKKSDAVQYSDKFQDEHIKKFKRGYYCEFCNILMPIASKVNLHITEDEHKQNKGILLLKPMGGDVVAFNNILIEEKTWHGLMDGVCSICNEEFEDETDHKTDGSHCLNLVLKHIQFGADNAIFRQLDDTAVQCLTCNKLLAPSRMTKHFDDKEHYEHAKCLVETNGVGQGIDTIENCQGSEARGNCRKKATNMTSAIENHGEKIKPMIDNDVNKNSNEKSPTKDKFKILESIARYQNKGININLETETAFCKKCSKVVTFDVMEIENHIENHSPAKVNSDLLYPSNLDQNLNRVDINDKTTQSSDNKQNTEVENVIIKALEDNVQNAASKAASHGEDNDTDSSSSDDEFEESLKGVCQKIDTKENCQGSEAKGNCREKATNMTSAVENDGEKIKPKIDNDVNKISNEKCSQEEVAREFAKANKISYSGENKHSFCRICKVNLPAFLRSLKEHVEGANHKRLVASSITQPKTPGKQAKQSTRNFVYSVYEPEDFAIINEEFCILKKSCYLMPEYSSRMRCILCEVNLPPYTDVEEHVTTKQHSIKWLGLPVIISEKEEFIREVRPGLYHCGYCHLVVAGWADMKRHLECSDHLGNRFNGGIRLIQFGVKNKFCL